MCSWILVLRHSNPLSAFSPASLLKVLDSEVYDSPTQWPWTRRKAQWSRRLPRGRCWCPSVCRRTAAQCPCGSRSSPSRPCHSCSRQAPAGPLPELSACSPGSSSQSGRCPHRTYLQTLRQDYLYTSCRQWTRATLGCAPCCRPTWTVSVINRPPIVETHRKPRFSPDTSVFSALETFVIMALYKSTFTIPYHTIAASGVLWPPPSNCCNYQQATSYRRHQQGTHTPV